MILSKFDNFTVFKNIFYSYNLIKTRKNIEIFDKIIKEKKKNEAFYLLHNQFLY